MSIKEIAASNKVFFPIIAVFVVALAATTYIRAGKDLKVGLFGAEQILHHKSPYRNPLDPNRAIYRYAPGSAIILFPFLLKSRMTAPYAFADIGPSVIAWYIFELTALAVSAFLLLRIIPASSPRLSVTNLKLGLLMSLPLIGYEISNGQNKLAAFAFMLGAIYLFEQKKFFWSAFLYNLALTIYIPLFSFVFYFALRGKGNYVKNFILAAIIVFLAVPSLAFGMQFNLDLLKEWFMLSLKPFFFTHSYATYIDLRVSSQSLPSAAGRLLVTGNSKLFTYAIPPEAIHAIVRFISTAMTALSCLAVWKNRKSGFHGLEYAIFFILAFILPQYCLYYTWAGMFVVYAAIFNYTSRPEAAPGHKRLLYIATAVSFISGILICVHKLNQISMLFWATLFMWLSLVIVVMRAKNHRAAWGTP